jgi:hypothetical protein
VLLSLLAIIVLTYVRMLLLSSQVAACQGSEGDATPFTDVKVDDVSEELHKRGYQRYGWEVRARITLLTMVYGKILSGNVKMKEIQTSQITFKMFFYLKAYRRLPYKGLNALRPYMCLLKSRLVAARVRRGGELPLLLPYHSVRPSPLRASQVPPLGAALGQVSLSQGPPLAAALACCLIPFHNQSTIPS